MLKWLQKKRGPDRTEPGRYCYTVAGLNIAAWSQRYQNPVNKGDHVLVKEAYSDRGVATRVLRVEHEPQKSYLHVESIEHEIERQGVQEAGNTAKA